MTLALLLHFLGISLWFGAGVVALLFATGAAADTPLRLPRLLLLDRIYAMVIAPAAVLATASGLALTMMVVTAGDGARISSPSLAGMQVVGLAAGLFELFVVFPAARRLALSAAAAVAAGAAWSGEPLRRRLVALEAAALTLVVLASLLGIWGRPEIAG
jgi:hypothetical protein